MSDDRAEWWNSPLEVAPRVWWVGAVRPIETFQCHAYLVEAGDSS
jgi:hypothetical protein